MSFYQFNTHLKLHADPIQPLHAVTKRYVDAKAGAVDGGRFQIGTLAIAKLPGFVGDVTSVPGTNNLFLADSGVAAGVKYRVDVDSKGRVTGGDLKHHTDGRLISWNWVVGKPTTIAGYGITDAVSRTGGTVEGTMSVNADATAASHAVRKSQVDSLTSSMPLSSATVGDMVRSSDSTTPVGFFKANGGVLSKTGYPALYAVIGDVFNDINIDGYMGQPWSRQAVFNTTQAGAISGWAVDTNLLPGECALSQPIVTKNRVYLLGQFTETQTGTANVYTATIDANGVVGAWTTASALPAGLGYAQAIITKNRAYLIGGFNGSNAVSTIYTATINANGTLNAWALAPIQLPVLMSHASLVVIKNRVHLIGGYTGSTSTTASNATYTAPINADGTLGAWTAGPTLPAARVRSAAFTTSNRVYLLGGADINNVYTSTVYIAPINEDGTLGTWAAGTALPTINGHMQVLSTKNQAYIFGGHNASAFYSAVYMAPIGADGVLGAWTSITSLDTPVGGASLFTTSSRVYIASNSTGARNTLRFATFTGKTNDYLGLISANVADATQFKLPDWTAKETDGLFYYVKF